MLYRASMIVNPTKAPSEKQKRLGRFFATEAFSSALALRARETQESTVEPDQSHFWRHYPIEVLRLNKLLKAYAG